MNVKDKLEGFKQMAIDEALEQRKKALSALEEQFAGACREIEYQAAEIEDARYKDEVYKAEQQKNKEIVMATTESKKALIDLRNQLLEESFVKVEQRLKAFALSDAYPAYLIEEIKKAMSDIQEATVYLMEKDMGLKEKIIAETGAKVQKTEESFIGGFKILFHDNALLDNSFLTRLEDAKQNYNTFRIE